MSCQKATGVAKKMQEIFKDALELQIHLADSPEALPYNLRSSTNVFVNDELVPLDVALDEQPWRSILLLSCDDVGTPHSFLNHFFLP